MTEEFHYNSSGNHTGETVKNHEDGEKVRKEKQDASGASDGSVTWVLV